MGGADVWLPNLGDVGWMSDVVSRHAAALGLPGPVTAVQLLDVRLTHPHRPESPRCRGWATYLVTTRDGAPVQLYVKGYPTGGASETAWRRDQAARPAARSVHLPDLDLVVWPFPEDPRLRALPELVGGPRPASRIVPPAVREVLGWQPGDELRATVVRYQPEASATLRYEAARPGAPAVFAKHLGDGVVAEVAAWHTALLSTAGPRNGLRIATPLAADPVRGVLWTQGVPGSPMAQAVPTDRLPAATARVGTLLAALHGSALDTTQRVAAGDLLVEMHKKAAKLVRAHPPVAPSIDDLVTAATRRLEAARERVRTVHGDFHIDQLVWSAQGPVLVDLDSIASGPPELDLAEFLVDLALRGLPRATAQAVARALLSSYTTATGGEVDGALLTGCADAEFVNRCYRHLRRHTPGWQSALEAEVGRHSDVTSLLTV